MQVYVVFVDSYLDIVPVWIEFSHFLELYSQVRFYAGREYLAAESGRPDYVILGFVYCMGLFV